MQRENKGADIQHYSTELDDMRINHGMIKNQAKFYQFLAEGSLTKDDNDKLPIRRIKKVWYTYIYMNLWL